MIIQPSAIGGGSGTLTSDAIYEAFDEIPEMHRNIFRGKNLGSTFTDEQKAAIADGSFHDLWIGDYWEFDENRWRIAEFDYYYIQYVSGKISSEGTITSHHISIIPDFTVKIDSDSFVTYMYPNSSKDTDIKGYYKSQIRDIIANDIDAIVMNFFGSDHVDDSRKCMSCTGSSNSQTYGDDIFDSVVGCIPWACMIVEGSPRYNSSDFVISRAFQKVQMSLFRLCPEYIIYKPRSDYKTSSLSVRYWLQDIFDATDFYIISGDGSLFNYTAHRSTCSVRPLYLIK